MFARRRTYLGFGGFLVMESIILLLLNRDESRADFQRLLQQHGLEFDHYFSGLTLAGEIVAAIGFIPAALFLALVAGDVMANEAEEGTLRMVFSRPVSRFRIALLKYISCLGYTIALIGFLGVTSLIMGIANQGRGGLFVWSDSEHVLAWHEPGTGMARYFPGGGFSGVGPCHGDEPRISFFVFRSKISRGCGGDDCDCVSRFPVRQRALFCNPSSMAAQHAYRRVVAGFCESDSLGKTGGRLHVPDDSRCDLLCGCGFDISAA